MREGSLDTRVLSFPGLDEDVCPPTPTPLPGSLGLSLPECVGCWHPRKGCGEPRGGGGNGGSSPQERAR